MSAISSPGDPPTPSWESAVPDNLSGSCPEIARSSGTVQPVACHHWTLPNPQSWPTFQMPNPRRQGVVACQPCPPTSSSPPPCTAYSSQSCGVKLQTSPLPGTTYNVFFENSHHVQRSPSVEWKVPFNCDPPLGFDLWINWEETSPLWERANGCETENF